MIAAVTGASGHLGANLVRALLAEGHEVRALVRDDVRALEGLAVARVHGDVLAPQTLPPLVAGVELVFHLAGIISLVGDPDGLVTRTNVEGPRHVAAACLAAGVRRLVHVSSIHAFTGLPPEAPVDEARPLSDTEPHPAAYDRSKALGQREVMAAVARGLDAVVVNPTAVVGPHDFKGSRMGRVLVELATGRLPGLVEGGYSFVDARDVAAGMLAAAERGRRGEAYLLPGHWTSVAELARLVEGLGGARPPRMVTPWWVARGAAPVFEAWGRWRGTEPLYSAESLWTIRKHRNIRADKAARELGWAPRPFAETVRVSLAWFRERGAIG